ncbi:MAG: acetyl-CoA hydrolase/transferase family protein [Acidimicrobiia bacterium]
MAQELSPEAAADLVRDRDVLAFPLGPGQPMTFLHALSARESFDYLRIGGALALDLYPLFLRPGVQYRSGFFALGERVIADQGGDVEYVPADFRRFGPILEQENPRIMTTVATLPDAEGWMSLSLHAGASVDEIHRAGADPDRILLVEVNDRFPRTFGVPPAYNHAVHIDEVDVIVHGDRPPFVLPDNEPSPVDRAIAETVARFVHDGSTLQTGIGGIPSAVARVLAEGDGGDYGVHSEMFTTGLMHLHQAGKVTNARKGQFEGMSITTFALGTDALYEWIDNNDAVRFLPVSMVNDPVIIGRNHNVVAINGALMVDLYGQVVADVRNGQQFSGVGGHEDFVAVAGQQLEDRSLICMPSTANHNAAQVSRIVAQLPAGSVVTTPRHQVDVVVTEFGAAELRGGTVRERARALAAIAHPDCRAELDEAAARMR